jgi:hypothetical protein
MHEQIANRNRDEREKAVSPFTAPHQWHAIPQRAPVKNKTDRRSLQG